MANCVEDGAQDRIGQSLVQELAWDSLQPQVERALLAATTVSSQAELAGYIVRTQLFNGTFGPMVESPYIDVCLPDQSATRSDLITAMLTSLYPTFWRVQPCSQLTAHFTIDSLRIGVRNGKPVLLGTLQGKADADEGRLEPASYPTQAGLAGKAQDYLSAHPSLTAGVVGHDGTPARSVSQIEDEIRTREVGGRKRQRIISAKERPWADLILRWHSANDPVVETVPMPERHALPRGDPWVSDDASFRSWVVGQVYLDSGPPDQFLHRAIVRQRGGDQKPSHQGWEVSRHGVTALLMLDTSRIPSTDRRAMRVATLLHDLGKLNNVWTRGAHARIGARLWHTLRPSWLSDSEAELVTFLISSHDALGFLDRGLKDHTYRGGLSPNDVRRLLEGIDRAPDEALQLISAIYHADISAVPTLRWLRPLTPLLQEVVRAV